MQTRRVYASGKLVHPVNWCLTLQACGLFLTDTMREGGWKATPKASDYLDVVRELSLQCLMAYDTPSPPHLDRASPAGLLSNVNSQQVGVRQETG